MIKDENYNRCLRQEVVESDLTIVGGGLSGVCAAITAAREGVKVTLVQDRPVLGGNSSSEVRLWVLGATSHMGNNNRWAREGGVIDEILVENTFRNKEGNPVIFDSVLLDKVISEPNITLILNTSVYEVTKSEESQIAAVKGFCSQNSTEYILKSPLFCDASGDGVLGFLSGAAFRMGAEGVEEFGEKFAPTKEYGELLGHSLYFYSKDTGKPVKYQAPSFALSDIKQIPKFRNFNTKEYGCKLWWIEYGGRLDTIHDTENIKWELWKVVYGVWDYIKNSGEFPEAENLTLEWVGMIPGKRESRRFEGDYILNQQDIVEQNLHEDAVAMGGWSIDLHPADGIFSEKPGCNQWHSKGMYQIPYRCLYSRNISNLFLAGRIISASHIAFASTRVMATGAHVGQAVGIAAKVAKLHGLLPVQLVQEKYMKQLQNTLLKGGQFIPRVSLIDNLNLVGSAVLQASSKLVLDQIPKSDIKRLLDRGIAQMLPLTKGKIPVFTIYLETKTETSLKVDIRISSIKDNHTPDVILESKTILVKPNQSSVKLEFEVEIKEDTYAFLTFHKNTDV
ncbi:MAG TPA: FAD-dependent oxidoreductase, partial [Arachidicoccus soli]|nr:FAD-dependent oxidoreductase [Arachidicoccus soli]